MSGNDSVNWFTNPLLGSIIGAVAGSIASFYFGYWTQSKENKRFKKEIRQFVKDDLNIYYNILEEILTKGTPNPNSPTTSISITDPELSKRIWQYIPDYDSQSRMKNYLDLTLETKARVFNHEVSSSIEKIYKQIPVLRPSAGMELFFIKQLVIELKNDIKEVMSKI